MPVSDHYNRYEKLAVRIITVDTSALRVEGVGKDAAVIQISVSHRPPGFRWPIEGELWIIEREASDWALVSKIEGVEPPFLRDGEPGDFMGPDGYIPQHKTKATVGQGLVWASGGWIPENLATQIELNSVALDISNETIARSAADNALDARLDVFEAVPTWSTPSFLNSWIVYDTPRYSKDALGFVQMRGEVQAWTGGVTAADVAVMTLPVGFRPVTRSGCPVWANDAALLSLYVGSDGVIRISRAVGASVVVNLNAVRFPTV